ncbi:hypothetical protein L6R50_10040 [Myxococcota bacterium]|nr:hypothetical protein [Myxococcota bacterium]
MPVERRFGRLALLALLLLVAPRAAIAGGTAGVLELTGGGKGLTKNVIVNLTSLIASEVDIQGGYDFSMQHAAGEFPNGCPGDVSCLKSFASQKKYAVLLAGSVTSDDGTLLRVKLRLFDAATGKVKREVEREVPSAPDKLVDQVPGLVAEVLTGKAPAGPAPAQLAAAQKAEEKPLLTITNDDLFGDDDEEEDPFGLEGKVRTKDVAASQDDERPPARASREDAEDEEGEDEIDARLADEERREAARKEEEDRRSREAARRDQEEKERREAARRAEEEAGRREAARKAEEEQKKRDAERRAAEEKERREAARRAEEEEKKKEAERLAEADRRRREEEKRTAAASSSDEIEITSARDLIVIGDADDEEEEETGSRSSSPSASRSEGYSRTSSRAGDDEGYSRTASRSGDDGEGYSRTSSRSGDDGEGYSRTSSRAGDDDEGYSRTASRAGDGDEGYSRTASRAAADESSDDGERPRRDRAEDRDGYVSASEAMDEDEDEDRLEPRRSSSRASSGGSKRVKDLDGDSDYSSRSSRGRARVEDRGASAKVAVKVQAGATYFYRGMFSADASIGIHAHRNFLIDIGFGAGWTSGEVAGEKSTFTLPSFTVGVQYKGSRGSVHPFVGLDGVFILYNVDPEDGARFAPGARFKGGADFLISDKFGFYVQGGLGVIHAAHIEEVDATFKPTWLLAGGGAGIVLAL